VVLVTYGITSRVSMRAVREARKAGIKVGHLRLVVVWPFPEDYVRRLAEKVKAMVVPEINLGQIVLEVERCAAGKCTVTSVPHAGGAVHDPRVIYEAIVEAVR
jgi:2-oxoglutarate ferredoxin oxidoreductase subunit alpha